MAGMFSPESFLTRTLKFHPQGMAVSRILASAINAVAPDEAVRRFVHPKDNQLIISPFPEEAGVGERYDLERVRRVLIFGLGKAAEAMTGTVIDVLEKQPARLVLRTFAGQPRGLLVVKHPAANIPEGFEQIIGGHPVPDGGSVQAGLKINEFLSEVTADDLLICLISGGGSALVTSPRPGVSLEDLQQLTQALLGCGARIDEINTLRRHLDTLKGGGLVQKAAPARVISLILSDVVGSPLEAIASGPTAPDPSTLLDALGIIEKYDLSEKIPASIVETLQTAQETPKPGSRMFDRVQNVIVGDNLLAAQAALRQAELEGFESRYLRGDLEGEAREAATGLCGELRSWMSKDPPAMRPICMAAGGETTVTLHGEGRGGRNQELALAAVPRLAELPSTLLVSLATDGEDGPTDAAGAVASANTLQDGGKKGLGVESFLENNDAYTYFSALDDLLMPGPTGTNVNDLVFLFGFPEN